MRFKRTNDDCRRRLPRQWMLPIAGALFLLVSIQPVQPARAQGPNSDDRKTFQSLNELSLEQLGDVEITTVSKDPQTVQK
ncbi:MAG: hypothetical protein WBE76_24670, partial [Terracidiphilus sp.]